MSFVRPDKVKKELDGIKAEFVGEPKNEKTMNRIYWRLRYYFFDLLHYRCGLPNEFALESFFDVDNSEIVFVIKSGNKEVLGVLRRILGFEEVRFK